MRVALLSQYLFVFSAKPFPANQNVRYERLHCAFQIFHIFCSSGNSHRVTNGNLQYNAHTAVPFIVSRRNCYQFLDSGIGNKQCVIRRNCMFTERHLTRLSCVTHVLCPRSIYFLVVGVPDSKVLGANMGPTWVLSAPNGPHVGPMNLDIRGGYSREVAVWYWLHDGTCRLAFTSDATTPATQPIIFSRVHTSNASAWTWRAAHLNGVPVETNGLPVSHYLKGTTI